MKPLGFTAGSPQRETAWSCSQQQPRYSRDAIAEFELITNRFDATQGRSQGMVVNAITKSGTNTPAGTFSGYFRDDAMNAEDFIQQRVLPYSDQQLSGTFGGPIRRDRIHFFGNYEYEREPQTITFDSPYPAFNIDDLSSTRTENKGGFRFDTQFSSRTHLMPRGNLYKENNPHEPGSTGGATVAPSSVSPASSVSASTRTCCSTAATPARSTIPIPAMPA